MAAHPNFTPHIHYLVKQLKVYINLLLLVLLMLSSFSTALITASFKFNEPYIVAQLCKNRARPEMKCNGKCHLKKLIQEDTQDKNKSKKAIYNKHTLNWLSYQMASFEFTQLQTAKETCMNHSTLLDGYTPAIDHPPS